MNGTRTRTPCAHCGGIKISEVPNGKWWVDVECASCGEAITTYRRLQPHPTPIRDMWIIAMQSVVLGYAIYVIAKWIITGEWTQ